MLRLLRRLAAISIISALAQAISCASDGFVKGAFQQPAGFGLPALALLDGRAASGTADVTASGIETFARSAGCIELGSNLYLASVGAAAEWAVYRLQPPTGMDPQSVSVELTDATTDEAWIGRARFVTGLWEFSGAFTDSQQLDLAAHGPTAYVSPGGFVYVAVVCAGAHSAVVEGLTLTCEGNLPPVASFTATPQSGSPGEPVTLDASASSDPDGSIVKYEWDLDGDGTFELDKGTDPLANTTLPDPAGTVEVGLRVTDDSGTSNTVSGSLSSDEGGSSWLSMTIDSTGNTGKDTSLEIVDGRPAISYYDFTNKDLKYLRANNDEGTSWGSPITVDSDGDVGSFTSLTVVNGRPAISYYDFTSGDLKYARASNAEGSAWNVPLTLDSEGNVGIRNSLAVIAGSPAVSYHDYTNGDLKYIRASDPDGSTWGTPMVPDSSGVVGDHTSLAVVNGHPAISYFDNNGYDLRYVRANDTLGDSWAEPQTLDTAGIVGTYTSLEVVNGLPAISYWDNSNRDLKFIRASNADGSAWASPQTLDSLGDVGFHTSLAIIGGRPAISYRDMSNTDLKYIRASDANGIAWEPGLTIDSAGDVGWYVSLTELNGRPAISYTDESNDDLKFALLQP